MDIGSCFKIGYISRTHGLKGEVTAILDHSLPSVDGLETVFVEVRNVLIPYFIEALSDRGDKTFIKLEDVNTPEGATALKGCSLYLPKTVRPKLARGEFYDDEVVGFEVEDKSLGYLGTIREVSQVGSNRLLVIDTAKGEVLIPVEGPFILQVNKAKKKIAVELPEGFLEIN